MNWKMADNSTIEERQAEIVAVFERIEDWEERYRKIIALGRDLPSFPEEHRTDKNKVEGCQSQVWLHAELEEGNVFYIADSDAAIVRGLIAMVLRVYSGRPPAEVAGADADFVNEIGLGQHLSPTRSNGLAAMLKQIKYYALAFNTLLAQRG
jgi:cysteine desulfuration protein SufE